MKFYLGVHQPHWLATAGVPLFVSHGRLKDRKTLPIAIEGWALDSRGFSELKENGRWTITPEEYVDAVRRYDTEIGLLEWAAPQDWMCEEIMINGGVLNGQHYVGTRKLLDPNHKLTLDQMYAEHERRTIENFVRLEELWDDPDTSPFKPVLQGDYLRCIAAYYAAGINLKNYSVVGLGSVCRRQSTDEIIDIVTTILKAEPGLPLHGFGVKKTGLRQLAVYTEHEGDAGHLLNTADSMSWSYDGRRGKPLPGCSHKNCANCLKFALKWREEILGIGPPPQRFLFDPILARSAA